MNSAEYLVEELKKINDHIFMLVGGGAMYLNDAVGRLMPYTCTHHEQAAAIAAEGYARVTGRPGLCLVTSGPGVTNTITGLYGAYTDSIPMIFVSGQMRTETCMKRSDGLRQLGDQEVDTKGVVRRLVKAYLQPVPGLWDVRYCIEKALYIATTGRPGPVWIDVPLDIQSQEVTESSMLTNFVPSKRDIQYDDVSTGVDRQDIVMILKRAHRPLIIAGHGIRLGKAEEKLRAFVEDTGIPYVTAFNSLDLEYPRRFGPFGTIGTTAANTLVQKADVLLILGCRMNIRQIGYEFGQLGKDAYKIMVDIDINECIKKTFKPQLWLWGHVGKFLDMLHERLESTQLYTQEWWDFCNQVEAEENRSMPIHPDTEGWVNPYRIIQRLNHFLQSDSVVVSTNGLASIVASQMLRMPQESRFLVNSGAGAMGYGLPMAIGAAKAVKGPVFCLEGDGSLQLNIQELQTLKHYNLPVKLLVFNNGGYASIRDTQNRYFEGRHVGADETCGVSFPDLKKIAEAYGIPFFRVYENDRIAAGIQSVLSTGNTPAICEFMVDRNAKPMPKGIQY